MAEARQEFGTLRSGITKTPVEGGGGEAFSENHDLATFREQPANVIPYRFGRPGTIYSTRKGPFFRSHRSGPILLRGNPSPRIAYAPQRAARRRPQSCPKQR